MKHVIYAKVRTCMSTNPALLFAERCGERYESAALYYADVGMRAADLPLHCRTLSSHPAASKPD